MPRMHVTRVPPVSISTQLAALFTLHIFTFELILLSRRQAYSNACYYSKHTAHRFGERTICGTHESHAMMPDS